MLLKNDSPDPILWGKQDGIAFKALKNGLINLSVLWHLNSQIPLLFFVHEKEGDALVVLIQNMGTDTDLGYYGQHLDPWPMTWGAAFP